MNISLRTAGFILFALVLAAHLPQVSFPQDAAKKLGDLIIQKRYDDVIALANRLAGEDPKNPVIYANRGLAYMYKSQWQKALDDFNRAIELSPEYWIFFHFRGNLYDTLGHLEKAVKDYDRSISLYPRAVMSLSRRGYLHWLLGHYDQAIRDAGRVMELNPSQYEAFRFRSLCFWVEGRRDQAVSRSVLPYAAASFSFSIR